MHHIKMLASYGKNIPIIADKGSQVSAVLLDIMIKDVKANVEGIKSVLCFVSGNVWDQMIFSRDMYNMIDAEQNLKHIAEHGMLGVLLGVPIITDAFLNASTKEGASKDIIVMAGLDECGQVQTYTVMRLAEAHSLMDESHLFDHMIFNLRPKVQPLLEAAIPMCKRIYDYLEDGPHIPPFEVPFHVQLLRSMREQVISEDAPLVVMAIGSKVWTMMISDLLMTQVLSPSHEYAEVLAGHLGNALGIEIYTDAFESPYPHMGFRCMEPNMIYMVATNLKHQFVRGIGIRVQQVSYTAAPSRDFDSTTFAQCAANFGVMKELKARVVDLFADDQLNREGVSVNNTQLAVDIAEGSDTSTFDMQDDPARPE